MTVAFSIRTGLPLLILVAAVAAREPSPGSACTLEGASNCQLPADALKDKFRIRVYADVNGLPGILLGETLVTGANIQRGPAQGTAFENAYGGAGGWTNAIPQGYTLTLDFPITGMVPGVRHWLEVTNNTRGSTDADKTCWWNWLQHFPQVGDGYSATGANSGGVDDPVTYLFSGSRYIHGSARMSAWFMSITRESSRAEPITCRSSTRSFPRSFPIRSR